jgi:nitrogen fixation-related uncharacterized protein
MILALIVVFGSLTLVIVVLGILFWALTSKVDDPDNTGLLLDLPNDTVKPKRFNEDITVVNEAYKDIPFKEDE